MKSHVADYKTRIFAVRIEAVGGEVVRFVDYPHDLVMGGDTYSARSGYEFTGLDTTSNMAPAVIDLQGIVSNAIGQLSRDEVASGTWDNARAYVFATSWTAPTEDEEPLGKFIFGKHTLRDDRYVIEFMHLIDAVTQATGRSYSPTCGWTLFDENLDGDVMPPNRSLCQLNINDYRVTGAVTDVVDRFTWRDSSRSEPDDYFAVGSVLWTTGANAGLRSQEIKSYASDGTVTQFLATHYPVEVGDEYEMIPGCRKRRVEDCANKYDNAINFGGFDSIPAKSQYSQIGMGGS